MKRHNPVNQKSAVVTQKHGGRYHFLSGDEDVDIAYIKSIIYKIYKLTELFFPNQGKCYFVEDINEYEGNILEDRLILKNCLKETDSVYPRCIFHYILSVKITKRGFFNNGHVDSIPSDEF